MNVIKLEKVKKDYLLGKVTVPALRGVDLNIEMGDFMSIAGPSGSGKTTLLNLIGCIDKSTEGNIIVDGHNINELNDYDLTALRHRTVGFIFQTFNLIPVLNIYENVEFPLLLGKMKQTKKEQNEWINHIIEAVGLSDRKKHRPNELSGGQRQRVAIARALVTQPKIVLADEPTANLDSATSEIIIDLMQKINENEKTTFVFSTHDPMIVNMVSKVIPLHDGLIANPSGV
ncbi:MAG: ABC transporter ATP-binding protein [Spirochaetaceae bacterium]|nr:ABC transporter ATP-binding protein [Spirochaetaceae bacterium]